MVFPLIIGCQSKNNNDDTNSESANEATEILRENTPDGLPDELYFNGREVTVFYGSYDPNFERKTQEVVGDMAISNISKAVYARNVYVEGRLGVKLVFEESNATATVTDYDAAVRRLLLSGDDSMDIIYHRAGAAVQDANAGYLREVTDLEYIDLSKQWWFDEQMRSVSLNENSVYLLMGDLLLSIYANMAGIFFNKELYDDTFAKQGRSYKQIFSYDR